MLLNDARYLKQFGRLN